MIRSSRRVVTSLRPLPSFLCAFFFFNDTATTEIYTLSLHDALPAPGAEVGGRLLETTARRPSGRVGALRQTPALLRHLKIKFGVWSDFASCRRGLRQDGAAGRHVGGDRPDGFDFEPCLLERAAD